MKYRVANPYTLNCGITSEGPKCDLLNSLFDWESLVTRDGVNPSSRRGSEKEKG
jgi:hypothetical protein